MKVLVNCAIFVAIGAGTAATERVGVAQQHDAVSYSPTVTMSQVAYHDIMARLTALESSMESYDLMPPDGGWKEVEVPSKPTQKWTGRIHADYWAFPETNAGTNFFERDDVTLSPPDRFLFRRLRLGMKGDILGTMLYKLEFDFAPAVDLVIKDAYIGWTELPILRTLLLGNQKRPYGLDHLNSSRHAMFMERPFVVESFNSDARRFGLCSYGVSDNLAVNWRLGAYLTTDMQKSGSVFAADDDNNINGKHHYQAEIAGRFANTIWYDETSNGRGYAHWAISGAYASTDGTALGDSTARFRTRPEARTSTRWIDTGTMVGAESYGLLNFEGVVNVGRIQCVGELMNCWVQRRDGMPDVYLKGGYAYLSYFLTGEHVPWDRVSSTVDRVRPLENFFLVNRCNGGWGHGWGAWQLAVRYSYGDFSDADILGGVGSAVTLGMNWWWTPYSRMQVNYIYGDVDQRYATNIDSDTGRPEAAPPSGPGYGTYQILGARFMVDF